MTTGYDNWRPDQAMLMDLQFKEGTGTAIGDWAKGYRAPMTATGAPTWTFLVSDLNYLSFNPATPDYIVGTAATTADLNFTSSVFSGALWVSPSAYGNRNFFTKSDLASGWYLFLNQSAPYVQFYTCQAGPTSQATTGASNLALNVWQFVGFTRNGASARIYLNGRDATVYGGTHVNPATASGLNFYVGINNGASAAYYSGLMWRPRIWSRALTAAEMLSIYEAERDLFGV